MIQNTDVHPEWQGLPVAVEISIVFTPTGKLFKETTLFQRPAYVQQTCFQGGHAHLWVQQSLMKFIHSSPTCVPLMRMRHQDACSFYSAGCSINVLVWVRIFCLVHSVLSLVGFLLLWFWYCFCLLPVAEILASCCCSVAKPYLNLCSPMNCNTPGFPVLHYLLEFAQTHVHWVGDAIQPSHPLPPFSPFAFDLSQHQGLFTKSGQSIGASVSAPALPMNIQGWWWQRGNALWRMRLLI